MKRLKHFLLGMENTTTYKEMYEGIMTIPGGTYGQSRCLYRGAV